MISKKFAATLFVGLVVAIYFIVGCGADSTPSDSTGDTAGSTAASSIGGALQGSDSAGTVFLFPNEKKTFWALGDEPADGDTIRTQELESKGKNSS